MPYCEAVLPTRLRHYQSMVRCRVQVRTDRAISPRLAIKIEVKGVTEGCPLVTVLLDLLAATTETGRTGARRKRGCREAARRCMIGYLAMMIVVMV